MMSRFAINNLQFSFLLRYHFQFSSPLGRASQSKYHCNEKKKNTFVSKYNCCMSKSALYYIVTTFSVKKI